MNWLHAARLTLGRVFRRPARMASPAAQRPPHHKPALPGDLRALPSAVDDPERMVAAIDRVFALGEAGMLVFGWKLLPRQLPLDVTVHDETGSQVSVQENLRALLRDDIAGAYRERVPGAARWCGFIVHVPLPTEAGDARAICFHYPGRRGIWLGLPLDERAQQGIPLSKEMLSMIPNPGALNRRLHDMFEAGLGAALEAVNQQRLIHDPLWEEAIESRQFGAPPESPARSVIVPLYGRCDFLRDQLAGFAGDADFYHTDLIWVVDYPALLAQTLALAARCHRRFNVAFRVVWYGRNLGFAGANNVGVRVSRADRLLLLNSDVTPQQPGWLKPLEQALDRLPSAGAVTPLLQFADGSVQHAGMEAQCRPQLPGFLLNAHPGKGKLWTGADSPFEAPMLTGACLLLRKRDYLACGGLDEGYLIGYFEDCDLCLRLRGLGRKLYLVPAARLWHLEQQSQPFGSSADVRRLIFLFNAWRYGRKIRAGKLVNPMKIRGEMRFQA
ncbi:MAG: glycosyltransferase [Salinisphaera sp.]|nr:glycosyltransferase [Salinisphaera sp.]